MKRLNNWDKGPLLEEGPDSRSDPHICITQVTDLPIFGGVQMPLTPTSQRLVWKILMWLALVGLPHGASIHLSE